MKRKRLLVIVLVAAVLVAGVAYANRGAIRNAWDVVTGADFSGSGHGSVTVTIKSGDTGAEVTRALVDAGVVKSYNVFYKLLIAKNQTFYPGSYNLNLEMSSSAALNALANADNRVSNKVTIKEGYRLDNTYSALSKATNIEVADFVAAGKQMNAIGIPAGEVSAEGWLFPATYDFDPGLSATQILSQMVVRTKQELAKFKVDSSKWHEVLTLAALVQKEGRISADFYKISRVFLNRIAAGMHLQSDATVSYGVNGNTVSTSAADRANRNGYNTYLNAGLPIGPIGAPGATAIDAALHPAAGKWLFFCAVNLATGETVFSETYAQHQAAVRQWQAWMREHPGYE